jgi:nucleoside-triphosphatase THEP1
MAEPRLAGILYGEGQGPQIDDMLIELVGKLRDQRLRLAGAIQHNTDGGDRCRCDMTLEDLATGKRIDISERRGPESRGCRLDSFALEASVGVVAQSLSRDRDLVVINRFGKREAEGHGFRQIVEQAIEAGLPVLVAVASGQRAAWDDFTGSYAEQLPAETDAILAWCARVVRAGADA